MQKNQKQNFVSTSEVRKTLVRRVPQFNNFDQHDAHEFLSLWFEHVTTEMNRARGRTINQKVIKEKLSFSEQADLHWQESLEKENSIVQDFFQGQVMTILTCEHCKGQRVTFELFTILSLSMSQKDMNHNPEEEDDITLLALLKEYSRPERLAQKLLCEKCKKDR